MGLKQIKLKSDFDLVLWPVMTNAYYSEHFLFLLLIFVFRIFPQLFFGGKQSDFTAHLKIITVLVCLI